MTVPRLAQHCAPSIPEFMRKDSLAWAVRDHIEARPPDFRIGSADEPYLLRWFVVRQGQEWLALPEETREAIVADKQHGREQSDRPGDNVFVHQFWRSDDDRALHDHPWPWTTIILDGEYLEHRPADPANPAGPTEIYRRRAGDIVTTPDAETPHRVELLDDVPVTTLFYTGSKIREWGFWCEKGWVHWRDFTAPGDSGQIGRGCE